MTAPIQFIDTQDQFKQLLDKAQGSDLLAIDTEFLREKTYWPKLCLLQLATEDDIAIVDPLKVHIGSLARVLDDRSVVKVLHAASQDVEILLHETDTTPKNVFDTQVAATLLGHAQQIGYGGLVRSVCGVRLKKADSFTDWSRRPLNASQVDYAADDVAYLPQVYRTMVERLTAMGRLHWLDDDFRQMEDPRRYDPDPKERWRHLKRVGQLNRRQLSAARDLAAWRERRARKANVPRKWVMTDEQVIEACKRAPKSIDELFMVRGLSDRMSTQEARDVVRVVDEGLARPEEDWPSLDHPRHSEANVDVAVDLMNAVVRKAARENDIAPQTLASHNDLVELARGHDVELLHGWRREMIGNDLVALVEGRTCLSLDDGRLVVKKA